MQFRWHQATLMRTCYCSLWARNNVVLITNNSQLEMGAGVKTRLKCFAFANDVKY